MELKNLITSEKIINVEYPGLDGFNVSLAYVSREQMKKIMDKSTTTKYNKRTHQPEEEVDNDLFLSIYVKSLIKGWKGLKLEYLKELLPVNLGGEDPSAEMEYSEENALQLMKNSSTFDTWVSTVIGDIANFNKSS